MPKRLMTRRRPSRLCPSGVTCNTLLILGDYHCALKLNESFSRLLDKQVSFSWYLAMTLEESTKLEACIRGQLESQSYSLWAISSVFTSLKDSGAVPKDETFHHLVSSLKLSLQSLAMASILAACFLQQKHQETLVSHLPSSTQASVKHALLLTPSSSSLFAEEVIKDSLTQVKEDSQLNS